MIPVKKMCPWRDIGKQAKSHEGFTSFLNIPSARFSLRGFSALLPLKPLKFIATMKNATVYKIAMKRLIIV